MSAPLIKLKFNDFEPAFLAQGFESVGAVDYQLALPTYQEHAIRYKLWIAQKKHGSMAYLERGLDRRLDPTLVFPNLKSVVAVALPYSPHAVQANGLKYARYLNGPDYHEILKSKLESSFEQLKTNQILPKDFEYKICVDTSAVLERSWALLCGLGWIGKNTLLIHPQLGSYLFLGVVFTNAEFGLAPNVLKDYCGSCTRCIRVCPTEALKDHDLDANTCISYLTLEKRGAWEKSFPSHGFLAGCDLCQEVCPYNTKALKSRLDLGTSSHLSLNPEELLLETEEQYKARVKGTALSRIKYADFKRNLNHALSALSDAKSVKDDGIL
jgi:epoxyqueuosine reductase